MTNPTLSSSVRLVPISGGYICYDPVQDRLHELNPSAALIVELCNGRQSLDDIRRLAGPLMPEGDAFQIDRWIEAAIDVGLLVWSDGPVARPGELPAAELSEVAFALQRAGHVQAAFQCGRRVADQWPDDAGTWYNLGELAQSAGQRQTARDAYERYLELCPDDATVHHILIALRDETPPQRASDDCIVELFQSFSQTFDAKLRDDLGYQGPERLADLVAEVIGEEGGLEILDLGCGTGLAGVAVKPRASRLTGVDLSTEMIDLARNRGIYDALEIAEITEWLDRGGRAYDLIIACDCLVYFGDLQRLSALVAKRLKPGGRFAFTLERGEIYPFKLTDSGRFTHHGDHVREAASQAELSLRRMDEGFLRWEMGNAVIGLFTLLEKVTA